MCFFCNRLIKQIVNSRLTKKIDCCSMADICSFSLDIYVCKMEEDKVVPSKSIFYKDYADNTYFKRSK